MHNNTTFDSIKQEVIGLQKQVEEAVKKVYRVVPLNESETHFMFTHFNIDECEIETNLVDNLFQQVTLDSVPTKVAIAYLERRSQVEEWSLNSLEDFPISRNRKAEETLAILMGAIETEEYTAQELKLGET